MLTHLSIRDIVLIERLEIDLTAGLSVLTGETGAGKSILLDSLSLALGARGDGALVRQGVSQGQVTASFDVPLNHVARSFLAENAVDDEGSEILMRRIQTVDGRTRGFINDQPVSAGLMRQLGRLLVEIHGQHDDRALVDPAAHRTILDSFGGHLVHTKALAQAWHAWRAAEQALRQRRAKVEAAEREGEFLRSAVKELADLDPQPGEEESLAAIRTAMMHAEKIATEISDAQEVLSGGNSVVPQLSSLLRRLQRKAPEVPGLLDEIITSLDEALLSLDGAQSSVEAALRASEYDPAVLEQSEERLFSMRAAGRKFNVPVDDLAKLRDKMVADLADLDAGAERLAALEIEALEAQQIYDMRAAELTSLRKATATHLVKAVMDELPALKLERAEFLVELSTDTELRGEDGNDQIEFWVRTNPGTRAGPIMKVASGGELSRFLLALKVALADKGSAPTLVFDEIDTGVGGAVADAIGQRLSRLSQRVQVLSVTHAPQVAARADIHYLITKSGASDHVSTAIASIDRRARKEEIARMLSGAVVTEEARAAAEMLLAGTSQPS